MSIDDMFKAHGEAEFRAGEARVIARILRDSDIVLGDRRRRLHQSRHPRLG